MREGRRLVMPRSPDDNGSPDRWPGVGIWRYA
jgi:hypothetical protein